MLDEHRGNVGNRMPQRPGTLTHNAAQAPRGRDTHGLVKHRQRVEQEGAGPDRQRRPDSAIDATDLDMTSEVVDADRRLIHESDPDLRTERRQLIRLSHRVTAARPGTGGQPCGVDALELPRGYRALEYGESCVATKDPLRPGLSSTPKCLPNRRFQRQIR